jgi:HD-GYP domain-containing protein (c-di-GMP phosphodiesterase class II)
VRVSRLADVKAGEKLGQTIFGAAGQPLLQAGVELTGEYLQTLHSRGMTSLYVEDPDTSDIEVPQPLSPATRARVTANLAQAFDSITEKTASLKDAYVAVARKEMQASRFADAIRAAAGGEGLYTVAADIDSMLDELKGRSVLAGLNSIKAHDSYTFQHSIDVTIMGLVLARTLNWERWRLRAFGVGCILHDLGKLFIDAAILNKPGKLTDDEYKQIKAHPAVGYDLIKALAAGLGVLAPHVALQHHERQDGTGYPRGIKGTNTLGENRPEMIHDFGSLSAIADVYDAMTSDRPYRAGWTPARTLAMIREGSGTHFNRQGVEIAMQVVPPFPVCTNVRVLAGKYAGWEGVVASVPRVDLGRPKVRLLFNEQYRRVEPVEINLHVERDVAIEPATGAEKRVAA